MGCELLVEIFPLLKTGILNQQQNAVFTIFQGLSVYLKPQKMALTANFMKDCNCFSYLSDQPLTIQGLIQGGRGGE